MKELSPETVSGEVKKSWMRCVQEGVPVESLSPQICKDNLKEITEKNEDMIQIFQDTVRSFPGHLYLYSQIPVDISWNMSVVKRLKLNSRKVI